MKPNVLFIVVDSLRADRFFGKFRTCKTPFIDELLKKGTYFEKNYSSSDVTGTCLGNMFTGNYSFKTGITLKNFNENAITCFDILKNHGYSLYSLIPDLTWFHKLTKDFDKNDMFFCANLEQDGLNDGLGEKIIDTLHHKSKNPWFYYIHLHDLHDKIVVPNKFSNNFFGKNDYDKQVSFIDSWLSKIINNIDLENTIIIITSDHGDYLPITNISTIPKIQNFMRKLKHTFPSLEPLGLKFFIFLRTFSENYKKQKLKKQLSNEQLRTLTKKGGVDLFDDVLHVPLFFCGQNIPSDLVINELTSGVDIFTTLLKILKINYNFESIDGNDLTTFFTSEEKNDRIIYLESGDIQEQKEGKVIGIRTNNYKYLRSRNNPKQNISLYDLKNDPMETNNLSSNTELVKKLENFLLSLLDKHEPSEILSTLTESEEIKINEELKKMGYIK
ncbi:MAG: hypothetical protein CL763_09945 [Chloroflexi bacterium]|nr:hypothetical protein [Chloroflexota bacterium]|tara:strand:+ start:2181 stop:3512 length:1332 start_codon:yes stop_codon:yes gene_type:complete